MAPLRFRVWDGMEMISPDYVDRDGIAWWKCNSISQYAEGERVMQSTDLHDKNGKEIFEGDILEGNGKSWGKGPMTVEWRGGSFVRRGEWDDGLRTVELAQGLSYFKVIGNIYENPELLPKAA